MDALAPTPFAYALALATILSTALALVSAIAAAYSARAANRQWEETRAMRRAQTEPAVFVGVQPREEWINWLDMVIQNHGQGFARDVRLSVEPDFEFSEGEFLSRLGIFVHGINVLVPDQKIKFFFTSMVDLPAGKFERKFQILVQYRDDFGNRYRNTYHINLKELSGLSQLGTPPLQSLAKDVKAIERNIDKLSRGFQWIHLRVHFRDRFAPSTVTVARRGVARMLDRIRKRRYLGWIFRVQNSRATK